MILARLSPGSSAVYREQTSFLLNVKPLMATRPACVEVLFDELATTAGHDALVDAHVAALQAALADMETIQYRARKIVEDISLALQGSLLVRHGHPAVAEAFLASRMGGQWGGAFGTLPTGLDLARILERAVVKA
jgi:putative acyl-CoA dehydrogenase